MELADIKSQEYSWETKVMGSNGKLGGKYGDKSKIQEEQNNGSISRKQSNPQKCNSKMVASRNRMSKWVQRFEIYNIF